MSETSTTSENEILMKDEEDKKVNMMAIAIILGTSLIVCLIIFLWVYACYGHGGDAEDVQEVDEEDDDVFCRDSLTAMAPRYTYKELEEATKGFSTKLGTGGFGSVYEGAIASSVKVPFKQPSVNEFPVNVSVKELSVKIAVKVLERGSNKEFRAEVSALTGISHVNLARLLGYCSEGHHRMLIYEYLTNGSLDRWLTRNGDPSSPPLLDWTTRRRIALDTARGLAFLHNESRDRIFHLDIKPQNILLDQDFVAKISDFGLSKMLDRSRSRTLTSIRGTPGYLAPEWLIFQPVATDKSDVYSYGMVLFELISGRRNFDYSCLDQDQWFWPGWVMKKVAAESLTSGWDEVCAKLIAKGCNGSEVDIALKVALWCVQEDPRAWPTMANVLLMLNGLLDVPMPPLPDMHIVTNSQASVYHHSLPPPPPSPEVAFDDHPHSSISINTSYHPHATISIDDTFDHPHATIFVVSHQLHSSSFDHPFAPPPPLYHSTSL